MSTRDEADEWLLDAARRAGHRLPSGERSPGTSAWRVLLNAGLHEDEVLNLACIASGTEAADFSRVSSELSALLPHGLAKIHRVVPLGNQRGTVLVATANPIHPALERELALAAKQRVRLQAGSPADIVRAQAIVYGAAYGTRGDSGAAVVAPRPSKPVVMPSAPAPAPAPALAPRAPLSMPALTPIPSPPRAATPIAPRPAEVAPQSAPPAKAAEQTPADRVLTAAIAELASEVVLEPTADGGLQVRLRVDGALQDRIRIPEARAAELVATFKRRSESATAATKRPQKGATTVRAPGGPVTVRVRAERLGAPAGDPLHGRERVSLRLRYPRGLTGLAELGYSLPEQERLRALLAERNGLIVVSAPRAAGKTATLYALAEELRQWGRLVTTIEETIDHPLAGVPQMQLRGSAQRNLSGALPALAATDADEAAAVVIADAALDAPTLDQCASSTSGAPLLVASLETVDLASTLAQLRALHPDGVPLAAALHGIVVQRLVRRLCDCALPQAESELSESEQRLLERYHTHDLRRPVGCEACHATGYRGRLAIAEVVPVTPALRSAIARRAIATELVHAVRESRVPTLWDSGLAHVLEGTTSLAELLDTVPPPASGDVSPRDDMDALLAEVLEGPGPKPPHLRMRRPPR